MSDLLSAFVPIFAFMLIPIWIPLLTAVVGGLVDVVRRPKESTTQQAVTAAKTRSAAHHAAPSLHLADNPATVDGRHRGAASVESAA